MKVSVMYSTLIVKDLDESEAFYADALGFSRGYHVDLPAGMGRITIMESPDGACVELIESTHYPIGMYSVGTDVDDLDEVLAKLAEKDIQPTGPIMPTSVGRQTFVLDPNGVRICLIEHTEAYRQTYMG